MPFAMSTGGISGGASGDHAGESVHDLLGLIAPD